jgi:hypothetical protein
MRFHFVFDKATVRVYFKSSKEEIFLGELQFVDDDKDLRTDVLKLLRTTLAAQDNPMLVAEVA